MQSNMTCAFCTMCGSSNSRLAHLARHRSLACISTLGSGLLGARKVNAVLSEVDVVPFGSALFTGPDQWLFELRELAISLLEYANCPTEVSGDLYIVRQMHSTSHWCRPFGRSPSDGVAAPVVSDQESA